MNKLKHISSLGKYTYGMYCYHMIVFFTVLYCFSLLGINNFRVNEYAFIGVIIISFFTTILISKLSYNSFELPFLKLKERFE
jgi:peptidoglycan/LPS O-acetylase OafA/YrhL